MSSDWKTFFHLSYAKMYFWRFFLLFLFTCAQKYKCQSLSHTQTHHADIHIHTFTHHTCNLQAMYTVEQKVCKRNILTYLHCSCTSYFLCTVQITTMLIHSKVKDPQDAAHSSFKYTFIFQRPLFLQFQRRM